MLPDRVSNPGLLTYKSGVQPTVYVGKTHWNIVPWCFFFSQTEGISMLRNELIQKEMVECSQTSKSKKQNYLKHSIYSLLQ